jgi:LysR family transcriptional activator of mexEF-oprN operon
MAGDLGVLREQIIRELDLNLLLTFAVIYREGSISKAAECLGIGQPAVSNALNRLRRYFNDPLFRRGYRKMCPTAKAIEIAGAVFAAMENVQQALMCADASAGTNAAG